MLEAAWGDTPPPCHFRVMFDFIRGIGRFGGGVRGIRRFVFGCVLETERGLEARGGVWGETPPWVGDDLRRRWKSPTVCLR